MFAAEKNAPDFEGGNLKWVHRQTAGADFYSVANAEPEPARQTCTFRAARESAELWNPETGEIVELPVTRHHDGRASAILHFEPFQSWSVVFRDKPSEGQSDHDPFPAWEEAMTITGE